MPLQNNACNASNLKPDSAVVFVFDYKTGVEMSNMQFGSGQEFRETEIHGKTKAR